MDGLGEGTEVVLHLARVRRTTQEGGVAANRRKGPGWPARS